MSHNEEPLDIWGKPIRNLKPDEYDMIKWFINQIIRKRLYFVTLKNNEKGRYVSSKFYDDAIQPFWNHGNIFHYCLETDSKDKLHAHFIFQLTDPDLYWNSLRPANTHLDYRKVYNIQRLFSYLDKQSHNKDLQRQLVSEHYFRHNYAFSPSNI